MRGIVTFPRQIEVSYTLEDLEGVSFFKTHLKGKCALTLRKEYDPRTGTQPYRVFIEGFGYPLSVFLTQIEPYMEWLKLIITPPKVTSANLN